jgi:hypothetical protein
VQEEDTDAIFSDKEEAKEEKLPVETPDRLTAPGSYDPSTALRYASQKVSIRYEPKIKESSIRNAAETGSLLGVWQGSFEYLRKEASFNCKFHSRSDITLYQSLPKWPETMTLEGRAKANEVASFVLKSMKSRTISGWLVSDEKEHMHTFR